MSKMQAIQDRFTDLVHTDRERKQPLSALPGFDASCMKEGYLQKKGQRFKSWKRRWFVCNGRTLSYYISRKDRKPNAVIPLESCTVQDGGLSETWNSPRINLTDGTTGVLYCLSAEEAEVVTSWLSVLRTAVAKLNGSSDAPTRANASSKTSASEKPANGEAKTLANYTDDEEDRFKPQPVSNQSARSVMLVSGDSVIDAKRVTRLVSGPTHLGARGGRAKTTHQPTSISLENELASGLDMLETLLSSRVASRHAIVFRPIGADNGVLKSLGSDPDNVKLYARD